MKRILILLLAASSGVFAQENAKVMNFQSIGSAGAVTFSAAGKSSIVPVTGAPYSATITNESIQTLADGNRIVQTSTGKTARDSQGRTAQDAVLPAIGGLSAANAPQLVFIHDPVAQTSYTLNLTERTALKMPALPGPPGGPNMPGNANTMFFTAGTPAPMSGSLLPPQGPPMGMVTQRVLMTNDQGQENVEELGSQTMEGVFVNGVRTTRTIPAGQIGNDNPIRIVTEVWTSPDLKTVVYSKRNDPRMGEQTFRLTNIVRSEPDTSLFTVPADFKVIDGPQPFLYRTNP